VVCPVTTHGCEREKQTGCGDPKDGELCLDRVKPFEKGVEARRGSDAQIDLGSWV